MLARDYVNETDDSIINNEDTYDQWAISSSKIFLGINVECISCMTGEGIWKRSTSGCLRKHARLFGSKRLLRPVTALVPLWRLQQFRPDRRR